jgi:hypothetical protein
MDREWFAPFYDTAPDAGPGFCRVRKSSKGLLLSIGAVQKAIATDDAKLMVSSVISSPCVDLQGDSVDPDGFDTSYHQQVRTVLLDHGQDYQLPVGLAEEPNTKGYTVRRAGDRWIADTYFRKDRIGEELYDLVKTDVLRGWSATFIPTVAGEPTGPFDKSLKRCPMRFPAVKLLEYSVTPNPINPEALTILTSKGGKLDPVIQKSFRSYLPESVAKIVVPDHPLLVSKAMDDTGGYGGGGAMADTGGDDMAGPTPTAKHAYDLSQALSDIITHVEGGMAQGEHKRGKKKLGKLLEHLKSCADEAKACGDMVMSDLDDEAAEDQMVDNPEPTEKSATGVIVIRKAKYEPVRWTAKDVESAVAADQPGVKRKSRAEREAEREAEKKQRLLDRINKKYGRLAAV